MELLQQKVKAGGIKIKRCEKSLQFKQNKSETVLRDPQQKRNDNNDANSATATKFWSTVCSGKVNHNENTTWLDDVEEDLRVIEVLEDIQITIFELE